MLSQLSHEAECRWVRILHQVEQTRIALLIQAATPPPYPVSPVSASAELPARPATAAGPFF